jgi:UTP--glucose-1-phosphate uridylyltransferase
MNVKKAVIAAGGRGTRFHPVTLTIPKEMLPVINRPVLQLAVEELIGCGVEEIVIVISPGKTMIPDYFKESARACGLLVNHDGERDADVRFTYVVQEEPRGLGHAVGLGRNAVGSEPFFLVLPDDIFDPLEPNLAVMAGICEERGGSVMAVARVPAAETGRYGIIDGTPVAERVYRVRSLVEKPPVGRAPSDLAVFGRYVLSPDIFDVLRETPPGRNGEIQITDALNALAARQPVFGYEHTGQRHDCGTVEGWLLTNIRFWQAHRRPGHPVDDALLRLFEDTDKEAF